ncbi:hypothetical protein ACNQRH_05930 [Mycolicibacterium peregrinum]|uniref:hypothetical protein n=1 Tax=Mycolicibacterium peregrinum TaxID=43304 RepID=UPI003AAF82E4
MTGRHRGTYRPDPHWSHGLCDGTCGRITLPGITYGPGGFRAYTLTLELPEAVTTISALQSPS